MTTICPTNKCQFNCVYCSQTRSNHTLSSADQDAIIKEIGLRLNREKLKYLKVTWFGGEPLVEKQVIEDMTPKLKALANGFGLQYGASIVTNGYDYTPELAYDFSSNYNITHAHITVDGMDYVHNRRRVKDSGVETFAKILENIHGISSCPQKFVTIEIRCNVDRQNIDHVDKLVEYIGTLTDVKDTLTNFYFSPVFATDTYNNSENLLSEREFADLELNWMRLLLDANINFKYMPLRNPGLCRTFYSRSLFFGANGQLFECFGNILSDNTKGESHVLSLEKLYEDVANTKCGKCNLFPVCGGICPPKLYKNENECPSLRYNSQERVLLNFIGKHKIQEVDRSVKSNDLELELKLKAERIELDVLSSSLIAWHGIGPIACPYPGGCSGGSCTMVA